MRYRAIHNVLAILALAGILLTPAASRADWFYDGNYPDVDWLSLETDHFVIHYYPDIEWTARMMAKYAEIAYPKVTGLFDYPLKEKVHIILRDMEENANGFAAYGVDWVTVWATPLYYVLRGRQEWIPDCFTHEFGHIVSLKVNDWKAESNIVFFGSGLIEDGVHNVDFGASVLLGFSTPFWWTEGIAEYSAHMAGFNWWTTSRDMHLRMTILDENALTFEEMFTIGDKYSGFDGEKGYQQGYSMALYVQEKYGKEQYAQLAVNSDRKGHLVWEKNVEDVLGVEGHDLYEGYINWMRDRYERQSAPIRKALHEGEQLFYVYGKDLEEEKLDRDRYKVTMGVVKHELALPGDAEEAEQTVETIEEMLKDEKDAQKKQRLQKLEPLLKDAIKRYEAVEAELPEDATDLDACNKFAQVQKEALKGADMAEINAALKDVQKPKPKIKYWDRRQRKAHYEGGSPWNMSPTTSPDGEWLAFSLRTGVLLMPMKSEELPVFSNRYISPTKYAAVGEEAKSVPGASVFNGYDWHPNSKKILYSTLRCPHTWLPCITLDGYYRYDLFEYDIETEDVERLSYRLRAVYPSYSPDGKTIAFVHIEDGQNWLGLVPTEARETTIDGKCVIDGKERENCIKWLIKKTDGTQLGKPSWSPDGEKIAIDLYRNHQQDIWMIHADGSGLQPLTWDRAEDRDGQFTRDGKHLLYVSDRTGIYNAYLMDLETREVQQLTNVIGGVYTPHLTASGDMLFTYFNSFGLHFRGMRKEDFYNKTVDAGYDVSQEEVARNLAYQEELPEIKEKSESYSPFLPSNWAPVEGIPLFLYERRGINIGTQLVLCDYLEKHRFIGQVLLGATSDYRLIYINNFWYPSFILGWVHIDFAGDIAQGIGSSSLANTRSEEHFESPLNYKYRQSVDFGFAGISYALGYDLTADLMYQYRYYTSQGRTDTNADAFVTNNSYMLALEYNTINRWRGLNDVNPKGRRTSLMYNFTRTGMPDKQFADVEWLGRHNPPGDHSDDYTYHEIQVSYQENIPISWWNKAGDHTLGINIRAGWQNRNVYRWDEFFAGSLHPLRYVPTQSTTQEFAGYEDFSLGGETMLILSLSYRFPLYRRIDRKFGPFYFAGLWAEIAGTAGNLWGYTAEYERDVYGNILHNPQSYWDPAVKRGTVRREVPFKDIAEKNGNYMLYDLSFVLKVKGYMFGYLTWNSFIRISYGLNDIYGGMYDINDDRVYVDNYPNDALHAETEPKSLRVSIGIGSNFD
ncbi:MAG: PD40 domain-containing protein [Deltaproteobacteria bacterium]|nr:PD40 domain-containing protein [Deltaproteobacteria bacterium]